MAIALRLAKGGWYGGDVDAVLCAPADKVMASFQYENFLVKYESQMHKMNRREATA